MTQTTSSEGRYYPEELPELRRKDRHLPLGDEPMLPGFMMGLTTRLALRLKFEERYPDDGVAPDCATRADFDYAAEAAAYQLVRKSPQLGPGRATLGFHGSWTFAIPGPAGHRWVRMVLFEKADAKPMSKLLWEAEQHKAGLPLLPEFDRPNTLKSLTDANEELWWCSTEQFSIRSLKYEIFLRHPRTVHPDLSEDELKAMGEHISPAWRHWPFEADSYGVPSWKLVEAEHPEDTERGPWEEWVPESWLENPKETGIWLLGTYQNDSRFSPLDESFLDDEHHKELASQLLQLLEQLGRKSEVELEALRFAGELDSKCVSLNNY
ncbi:LOW QUALITY PROTEIN: hypothetical protein QC762_206485 [Podospora pseudocomata]|uniref:Uncharacterized protein n=1 Tax=Podospora pseudocomata TaxID=2093779 RepID=A0ABR0GLR3_9PEZI|nr:LOW QUALITY PROTEIN: hypothetical protein QC762_206485 [Podospora pseudocomata]